MATEATPDSSGLPAEADKLRVSGKEHFQAQRFDEAARCYREALQALKGGGDEAATLGQAIRLNLVVCLQRLGSPPEEALQLCDEVLAADPSTQREVRAKALFWRGSVRRELSKQASDTSTQREALSTARHDLLQAARLEPGDRQVREKLEEVTEELKALPGGGGDGLRLGLGSGLYNDREAEPQEPPPPPEVCSVCGRLGHPRCGKAFWIDQRAVWLRMPVEQVEAEPTSFEHDGTLHGAILAERAREAQEATSGEGGTAASPRCGRPIRDEYGELVELSDEERDTLEDCLDAVERPYPQPLRSLPLPQAVRCAEELWAED